MQYNLHVTDSALGDMEEIHQHIAKVLLEPQTALKMIDLLEKSIDKVLHMPHSRPIVTDARLSLKGYRKLVVKNYIVFYTVDDDAKMVYVERALYGRRDWISLL